MTEKNIFQFKVLCAEILGAKGILGGKDPIYQFPFEIDVNESYDEGGYLGTYGETCWNVSNMKFDSNWNWIMEVLNKISSLDFGWKVTSKYVNIYSHSGDPRGEFDCKFEMNCPQDVVVDTVKTINQFLIWYNENKH